MRISIISSEEKALLKSIEESNDSDISLWKISNIVIPLTTILLSLACFTFFKHKEKPADFLAYFNLLLNGSIPMLSLNRIGGLGIYLFKFDKTKEKEFGIKDTYYLRTKLFYWFFFIVVSTMCLYLYQVSNNPFQLSWYLLIPFALSILSVIYSIRVAKQVYLLQEKMIENNYYKSVNNEALQIKSHLDQKYGG